MLTAAIQLREAIDADQTVIGVMATDHLWPLLVEICQQGGIDYLIIDREHGSHTDEAVAQVCQVARLANFPVLMRTVSCEKSVIRRAIDLGPCGLILPCVESTAQLDDVQNAIHMPPRGSRRPGGMGNYWMRDFQYETVRDEFEEHFIVIPQIESSRGVDNVDAIVSHPVTFALGLGPYDLSADLGCCWNPDDPKHKQAIATLRKAADTAGKKMWMGCDVEKLRAEGHTFLWIGSVSGVLAGAFKEAVNRGNC